MSNAQSEISGSSAVVAADTASILAASEESNSSIVRCTTLDGPLALDKILEILRRNKKAHAEVLRFVSLYKMKWVSPMGLRGIELLDD